MPRPSASVVLATLALCACAPEVHSTHYDSGGVWREVALRGGLRDGSARVFLEGGQVEFELTYAGGVLHGPWRRFHPD